MNISMVQGDDLRVFVTVKNNAGGLVDLAGATSIEWAASIGYGIAPILSKTEALGQVIVSGAGQLYFDITASNSGALMARSYAQEIQIVTSGGLTYTVGQGSLKIIAQIIGV
tara:strand:+ start:272 stop:607 length:336 start_codon:yes stop_codon:yes gene_type:complete